MSQDLQHQFLNQILLKMLKNISFRTEWKPKFFISPHFPLKLVISAGLGIRSYAYRSFAHFAQIKWTTVSDSLRYLRTNEQSWANRSGRSAEMSDCEQSAQVAQDKWVTVSDLLRPLMITERMSDSLKKNWLNKSKILFLSMFYIRFLYLKKMSDSLIPSFWWAMWAKNERFAQKTDERIPSPGLVRASEHFPAMAT